MNCIHPLEIENKRYNPNKFYEGARKKYLKVPCGKCINCLSNKANELAVKMTYNYEHKYNYKGIFLTLTYNEENIRYIIDGDNVDYNDFNMQDYELYNDKGQKLKTDILGNPIETLKRKDFQIFIKRLRNELQPYYEVMHWQKPCYVATSEYGTKGERPHYHAVILGIDAGKLTEKLIKLCWSSNYTKYKQKKDDILKPIGIIDVRPLTSSAGIGYVCKYTTKELEWNNRDPREKPKVWHSTGLDNQIIKDYGIEELKKNNFTFKYGNRDFKVGFLGKYYIHKFGYKSHTMKAKIMQEMEKDGIKKGNGNLYTNEQIEYYQLQKAQIKAKERYKKLKDKGDTPKKEKGQELYIEDYNKIINQLNNTNKL